MRDQVIVEWLKSIGITSRCYRVLVDFQVGTPTKVTVFIHGEQEQVVPLLEFLEGAEVSVATISEKNT